MPIAAKLPQARAMLLEIGAIWNSFVTTSSDTGSKKFGRRKGRDMAGAGIDLERFRLRRFVDHLIEIGEAEVHAEPVALADISGIIEASSRAVLFKDVGVEHFEIVGGVGGSRRRYAAAFGLSDGRELALEYVRRLKNPQGPVEVPQSAAPVQQVVVTGDAIDLTRLPFHVQHQFDGAPYNSSALDYTGKYWGRPASIRSPSMRCRVQAACCMRGFRYRATQ
jgi:hypothetical protein